jgi:Reverse transcriptase (RNA-dependent DNA polymerase).
VAWIPDTGSDVEAIDLANFKRMGGSIDMLSPDQEVVRDVTGTPLESLGCCPVVFLHGNDEITSVVHVFEHVNGAYASRRLLKSLKFLPESWPDQEVVKAVCRLEQTKETESKLRNEFSDVFDEKNLKPMKGSPMTIILEDNAIPHQERNARNIPVAYEGQVKKQLDDMLEDVIIERVTGPSAWCHPIVVVNKKGTNEMRMTVDLKKLNSQVKRPVHPMKTPKDMVVGMNGARYFTKFDARHGYWQVPLAEESRHLTTFITPWGRFRYCRDPQGFIAAGDEFNMRTDQAFEGIGN